MIFLKESALSSLLALHRLPGIGPIKFLNFINQHLNSGSSSGSQSEPGSGTEAGSLGLALANIEDIAETLFDKHDNCLVIEGKADWKSVEQDLKWADEPNHAIVTLWDNPNHYPILLKEAYAPPPILFVAGNLQTLSLPQLAMVGSRNPSPSGKETAHAFARIFANQGLCITSGLAVGIDGVSHQSALQAKGKTIAVLANGLDEIYPPIHRKLAEEIKENGALVSEFPIGIKPVPSHFPRRNRIISGLSMGTLVVEATLKSGSLITAKYALEQGREIFAIPGSIYSSQARGCHALIRQGAKLVETPQDVLEEMGTLFNYISCSNKLNTLEFNEKSNDLEKKELLSAKERRVLKHMGNEPTPLNVLLLRTGLSISEISSILLELELKGKIESRIGGYTKKWLTHE